MFLPIWFMLASPSMWLIVLPFDFLITTLMLWVSAKVFSAGSFRELFRRAILKLWLACFAGQLLASVFLFLSQGYFGEWWYEYITTPVALNPLDNPFSALFTGLGLAVAGVFTFLMDRHFAFKKLDLSDELRRKLALGLALLTLPTAYFLPSRMIYDPDTPVHNFTHHIVWSIQSSCDVTPGAPVRLSSVDTEAADRYSYILAEALNTAGRASASVDREAEFFLRFHIPETDEKAGLRPDVNAELWFMDSGRALMRVDGQFYLADEYQTGEVLRVLEGRYEPPANDWAEDGGGSGT